MALFYDKGTFLKSAAKGNMSDLNHCLASLVPTYFDVNVRGKGDKTALYLAAENGQIDAMKALIAAKADLNIPDDDGATPLYAAITNGKTAAARFLIAAGADVNTYLSSYVTPLLTAARYGQIDVVKDLVAAGADINSVSKETGRTPLHWAVDNGHGPVVEYLLTQNVRTDIVDRKGFTAVSLAEDRSSPRIADIFKAAKTKPIPAPAPAPAAVTAPVNDSETWQLMGTSRVAHVAHYPSMGRKLTEIFNFESRERVTISENLKTGAESMTQPEKFETLAEGVVARAEEQFKGLGGTAANRDQKKSFNL